MRATCLQENLLPALAHVSRAVASKGTLPILANALIVAKTGRLVFSATNLEYGVTLGIPAEVEEHGSLTVPAKLLYEFVASIPPGEVGIVSDGVSLTCTERRFKANVVGIPASEFPPLPGFPQETFLAAPANDLITAIQHVAFAASSDEGRQVLTGVFIGVEADEAAFVATDGYRLSKTSVPASGSVQNKLIVPARSLHEVTRLFGEQKGESVAVAATNSQLLVRGGETVFSSRTIDGQFPRYEKIIPTSFSTRVVVDHGEFLKAVKTAAVFARDSANIIKIMVRPGDSEPLHLSGHTAQVGDELGKIEASVEGEGLEIAFNSRYILDLLGSIKNTQVSLELKGELSPGLFRAVGDSRTIHIVMPVRTQTV